MRKRSIPSKNSGRYTTRSGTRRLREKYHATYLPTVYDKVNVDIKNAGDRPMSLSSYILQIWPLPGVIGLWKGIMSGDWRIPKTTGAAIMAIKSKSK